MLWDLETSSVVSNESSEIVRMLNTAFDGLDGVDAGLDLYPEPLRAAIDTENEWIYNAINNGVYKCGFARSQEAYQAAVDALFEGTDRLEAILSKQRYVASSAKEGMTEADVRAYVTCVRFDEVYVVYFKCNKVSSPLPPPPSVRSHSPRSGRCRRTLPSAAGCASCTRTRRSRRPRRWSTSKTTTSPATPRSTSTPSCRTGRACSRTWRCRTGAITSSRGASRAGEADEGRRVVS